MFWKTAADASRRPCSLAAHLSAWHIASTSLLLTAATVFLYWALVRGFEREDDHHLAEKISVLGTLLGEPARNARMIGWEVEAESLTHPGARTLSRILEPDGGVRVETSGMTEELPAARFPEPGTPRHGIRVESGGRTYRLMAAEAQGFRIQVALDLEHEGELLAGYRRQLWLVLGVGLVAAVLVGYRISHRGVRPLKEISAAMRRTSSTRLNERLETRGLPAELSTLAGTFNAMLDRMEEAFNRLSQFSSDIAHELRTPVNNLRLNVEVALSRERPAEEYRETLGSLLEEFVRLSRLIDSLLFLARTENPQTLIRREALRVDQELAAIREFYEAPASEGGVTLQVEAPQAVTAALDRTLFQRAVGNLIENALAHTAAGGSVTLGAIQADRRVLVSVSDRGCGIPASELAHIFDRFRRADPSRSRHSGGLGLGLAIVKSIAALHGGEVRIDSEVGRGTRVTLEFPADSAMTKT
jgi:two-component system heavy metal sensor histidine kinase CusS